MTLRDGVVTLHDEGVSRLEGDRDFGALAQRMAAVIDRRAPQAHAVRNRCGINSPKPALPSLTEPPALPAAVMFDYRRNREIILVLFLSGAVVGHDDPGGPSAK